jgi:hypothetical protein
VLLTLLLALAAETAWARPLDPARTWAIVVGVLDYRDPALDDFPAAAHDRQDARLVEWLQAEGVAEARIRFLADADATRAAIEAAVAWACAGSSPGDDLLLYFTGHGERIAGRGVLVPADARAEALEATCVSLGGLVRQLELGFRGDRVLAIVDCCYSGSLGDEVKGLSRRRLEWCCLASAESTATSTEAWTFTTCVLKALRGDPTLDHDGDGAVALAELRRFAAEELAFVERQLPDFALTEAFDGDTRLSDVVGAAAPGVGARVEVLEDGAWYRATVRRAEATRLWVDYPDYDDDGWVSRGRCRVWQPLQLDPGLRVLVEWEGEWWPARVLRSRLGLQRVHYDGHDRSWDEWVPGSRLRIGPY